MPIECTKELARNRSPYRSLGIALAAICTCLWFSVVANAQMSPMLRALTGNWVGTGTLSHSNGVTERIRCRVDYVLRGPQTIRQTLRCQSDTTNFDIVSTITEAGGRLTGDWTETNRNVRGTLTGTLRGGQVTAQVQGPGFNAGVGIAVKGNRQSVGIRAAGTDITGVTIALTRRSR